MTWRARASDRLENAAPSRSLNRAFSVRITTCSTVPVPAEVEGVQSGEKCDAVGDAKLRAGEGPPVEKPIPVRHAIKWCGLCRQHL
jgi:hypothetical protein